MTRLAVFCLGFVLAACGGSVDDDGPAHPGDSGTTVGVVDAGQGGAIDGGADASSMDATLGVLPTDGGGDSPRDGAVPARIVVQGDLASGLGLQSLGFAAATGGHYPGTPGNDADPEQSGIGLSSRDTRDRKNVTEVNLGYVVFGSGTPSAGSFTESTASDALIILQVIRGALPDDPSQAGYASITQNWVCCHGTRCPPTGTSNGTFSMTVSSVAETQSTDARYDRGLIAHGTFHGQCVAAAGLSPAGTEGSVTVDLAF
ncbi:MAG: hypothetical protein JWN48_1098 [Myxococcaceae bacterium]|nr:hypothetical protein [Myxococcaceae bacterium]